jgi:hypothetical protein
MSPLFDLEISLAFADDNFMPEINQSKAQIIADMENWLSKQLQRGLKIRSQSQTHQK